MLIPIGDINPVRRTPWVMRLLILANVAAFLLVEPFGTCARQQFFLDWAAVPAELWQGRPLGVGEVAALAGSSECLLTAAPDKLVYGAVLFSMFFHADLLHLGFNMLFLWVFGNNVEDFFGSMRFAAVYLLCGVIGTAAFAAANPEGTLTLVGASGAVAGVLGSYLLLHPTARVTVVVLPLIFLAFQLPALVVLGAWFLLQLREVGGQVVSGGGVASLAHGAGFDGGFVVTAAWGGRPQRRRRRPPPGGPPGDEPWATGG
jgi:membrane associated rhomboid family serine protease